VKPWERRVNGGTTGFMFFAAGASYIALLIWGIALLVRHTVQSIVLGVVVTLSAASLLILRIYVVRGRVRAGRNAVTGLASRARSRSGTAEMGDDLGA
jgi:hypothetical protein